MALFIVVVVLLVLNVLATRRLLQLGERLHMPRMRIAWVWMAPFVGAALSLLETHAARREIRGEGVPMPSMHREPPSEAVMAAGVEPFSLREHLGAANGFAVLDWQAAAAWLRQIAGTDARAAARVDLHRGWLEHLRDSIGETSWLHESDDVLILSSLEPAVVAAMSRYVTSTRRRIAATLGKLVQFPQGLKSVVLVVDDEEWYYRYISLYYPAEGEFALSSGTFINMGCPHFVVRRDDLNAVEPVIAHELTHSALAHLELPLWVDEGLAVNTEHRIAGAHRGLHTPRQLHAKHLAFWNDELIQQFWSGASFRRTDDGNMLSYDLARIMVAQMAREWPAFERFAQEARRDDAGAAAARTHMELDLGAYVSLMFEREPDSAWRPVVATVEEALTSDAAIDPAA
jgi:hypothetical protein